MILFYAAEENQVVQTLEAQLASYSVVRCRSLENLASRLRRPGHGLYVALVVVSAESEMAAINDLGALLRDLRLIIVLPNRDDAIVAWAHTLGPRFIAYADNGYAHVGAVLSKMIDQNGASAAPQQYGKV